MYYYVITVPLVSQQLLTIIYKADWIEVFLMASTEVELAKNYMNKMTKQGKKIKNRKRIKARGSKADRSLSLSLSQPAA